MVYRVTMVHHGRRFGYSRQQQSAFAFTQFNSDSILTGEILVKGTDTYAGAFSDGVGGVTLETMPLQYASCCFEHGVHRLGRTRLSRRFTWVQTLAAAWLCPGWNASSAHKLLLIF